MTEGRRVTSRDASDVATTVRERFRIERTLGEGGFGSVFAAHDQLRNARVALKTVHSQEHVLRLKREFRALAELRHPNLVELFELHGDGLDWFFTMELIDGPPLKEHLEMVPPAREEATVRTQTVSQITVSPATQLAQQSAWNDAIASHPQARARANVEKLRDAIAQIAKGLEFLHGAGKLHLDVKPSNVLVTREGRVMLADFGLARDKETSNVPAAPDELVLFGTPQYMAPEQATGGALGPATDAYSLGVLLYEALTGQLPFIGSTALILAAKQLRPPRVRDVCNTAPEALASLCDALLDPKPHERATIRDVLAVVGEPRAQEPFTERLEFVGRDDERAHLRAMLDATQAGGAPLFAVIDAPSGGGKSALVRAFIDEARAAGAFALSARCRADEWVAFEAVDAIVDQLASLSDVLPRELGLLFPGVVRSRSEAPLGRAEARRLGFAAFRTALRSLTDRAPTVLWIDDAQWGDIDSAALLADTLRAPDAPAVLVVCTVRAGAPSPMIDAIIAANHESPIAQASITLAPLEPAQARALLDRIARELPVDRREAIVSAAGGNPFFLSALASEEPLQHGADLDAHLRARIEALDPPARELLSALCIAGRALARDALASIAAIDGEAELRAVALLRAGRFVSVYRSGSIEYVDAWHDRVRDSAIAMVNAAHARALHLQIAKHLLTQREPDALALGHHLASAERPVDAALWFERAGDHAAEHAAFDAAARAYERALSLSAAAGAARRALLTKIGECWALAGRAVLAAHAFESASDQAPTRVALELKERAASLLLGAGHIERGLSLMQGVLRAVGHTMPRAREVILARLLVARAQLFARGLSYTPSSESAHAWEQIVRTDALHSVAAGLSLVDTIAGAYFSSVHLLEALRLGEPRRIGVALATEQCFLAGRGGLAPRRDERAVAALLAEIAERLEDRDLRARVLFARGTAAFLRASFDEAARALEGALALWSGVTGVDHERVTCEHFILAARTWMGQHTAVDRRLPEVLRNARDLGDLYGETTIETAIGHIPLLVRGEPDNADALLTRSISRWAKEGFYIQHFDVAVARVDVALYRDRGRGSRALAGVRACWPDIERSLLRQVQLIRVESDFARARAIVAALIDRSPGPTAPMHGMDRRTLRAELQQIHRSLLREELPWALGLSHCIGAALAMEDGDRRRAIHQLDRATGSLAVANIQTYRAGALLYRAALTGESKKADDAREHLRDLGVRDPDRFAVAFVPGRR